MLILGYEIPLWLFAAGIFLLGLFFKLAIKILLVIIVAAIVLFILDTSGFFPWLQSTIGSYV
jgi:hypothetical protein